MNEFNFKVSIDINNFIFLILIIMVNTCYSQESGDSLILGYSSLKYLKPTAGYGQLMNVQVLRDSNIATKNEDLTLQFIVLPSFEKTSITSILHNYKNNSYRIAYTTSKKQLFKSKNRHRTTKYRKISNEIAELTNSIFENQLINTHYPKGNKSFNGVDGTTYQFYINGNKYGQMSGETWSPQEGTNLDYLVKISKNLIQYTVGKFDEKTLIANVMKFKSKISAPQINQYEYNENHSLCNSEKAVSVIAYGSIAIQELAQDKEVNEYKLGGVLTIWRLLACDLLDFESDLLESTVDAIGKECKTIIQIHGANENDYVFEANKVLKNHEASIISLSWSTKPKENETAKQIIIVSDGLEELRVKYKGYGWSDSNAITSCVKSRQGVIKFNRY